MTKASSQSGFTLIEVLLALAIFSVVAGAGISVLTALTRSNEVIGSARAKAARLERTRAIIRSDLAQMTRRSWRDDRGDWQRPFVRAASRFNAPQARDTLWEFVTLGGFEDGLAKSGRLMRVRYRLDDDLLLRDSAPYADGMLGVSTQILLEGVRTANLVFFADGRWAQAGSILEEGFAPKLVELELETTTRGRFSLKFLTSAFVPADHTLAQDDGAS